jgi:hypothetical protein
VELLLARNLEARLPPMARLVPNDFRTERLYTEEVDMLLKKHQARGFWFSDVLRPLVQRR